MNKEKIKFCEDCKWSRVPNTGREFLRCFHPLIMLPILRDVSDVFCSVERKDINDKLCGRDGLLWEEK